tara:strand:- start:272 stop:409 length:138 start_codon:yes stop_codon:yes gene_type:complete
MDFLKLKYLPTVLEVAVGVSIVQEEPDIQVMLLGNTQHKPKVVGE